MSAQARRRRRCRSRGSGLFLVFATVLLLPCGQVPNALASSDADSTLSEAPGAERISLRVDGSTISCARLEPRPRGFVTALHADGTYEFWPVHRISWVRDEEGRDRSKDVLDGGRSLGESASSLPRPSVRRESTLQSPPKPLRKGFPIVQGGILVRLDDVHAADPSASLVLDIGGVKNLSPHYSVGGTLSLGFDDELGRVAAKARLRRWVSDWIAVDLAPGLVFVDESGGGTKFLPGFVGELSLSLTDWVTLTGQMETHQLERHYVLDEPYARGTYKETDVSWYLGAKLGGVASIAGIFVALAVISAHDHPVF